MTIVFNIGVPANSFTELNCGGVWCIYIKQIELDYFNLIQKLKTNPKTNKLSVKFQKEIL